MEFLYHFIKYSEEGKPKEMTVLPSSAFLGLKFLWAGKSSSWILAIRNQIIIHSKDHNNID